MFTEFCETCENEMYIKWHDEASEEDDAPTETIENPEKYMILFCKKCGNTKKLTKEDFKSINENGIEESKEEKQIYSPLIYRKNYENESIDSRLFNNEFITEDRTLPFVNDEKIECPNCQKKTDILYQIYDNDNMKFLYTCKDCKTSWTIN